MSSLSRRARRSVERGQLKKAFLAALLDATAPGMVASAAIGGSPSSRGWGVAILLPTP